MQKNCKRCDFPMCLCTKDVFDAVNVARSEILDLAE